MTKRAKTKTRKGNDDLTCVGICSEAQNIAHMAVEILICVRFACATEYTFTSE